MAKILLLANLNCDRILTLDGALKPGGRFQYHDDGLRIGGGGANTGVGLVWADHQVSLVSQIGSDKLSDWLLSEANSLGLDCNLIQRHPNDTSETLLMLTPDGERTIIRAERPEFILPQPPAWAEFDAFYINSSSEEATQWAQLALPHCLVVSQLAKHGRARPCHILIASHTDMMVRNEPASWAFGQSIAGDALRYFVVTDGDKGARVYSAAGSEAVSAVEATVIDTTGAGDSYAAGLIHGLLAGGSIVDAMNEGSKWSAFAVSSKSSMPSTALQQYLQSNQA